MICVKCAVESAKGHGGLNDVDYIYNGNGLCADHFNEILKSRIKEYIDEKK